MGRKHRRRCGILVSWRDKEDNSWSYALVAIGFVAMLGTAYFSIFDVLVLGRTAIGFLCGFAAFVTGVLSYDYTW